MESSNTFYSTSKNKVLIHFHKDHISFRLEADHAIRKTFYSEMDSISIQNKGKLFTLIFFIFTVLLLIASVYLYFDQGGTVLNIVTSLLLFFSGFYNWRFSNSGLIQVKKGGLLIDIFYSIKKQEVKSVFETLQMKLTEEFVS